MRFVKQNTAFTHIMGPFVASTDGYTPNAGITPVTTDWRISKNGGSLITKSSATTTIYLESGYYQVAFSSSDVDTLGHMKTMITLTSAGGALPVWEDFWVSESSEIAVNFSTSALQRITTGIWAESYASHTTAGTYGLLVGSNLLSPTSGVTMLAASQTALVTAVTTAIWAEALASHTTAGGAGKKLSDIVLTTTPDPWITALPGAYTTAQAGGIVNNIVTASSAIQAATTTLPISPASSTGFTGLMTSTGSTAMADAVWARNSEATESYGGQIRLIRAAVAGLSTGGGTAAISFYSPTTTIARILATVTTEGNRTLVTVTT
jgi:hypothetical protein